MLQEGKYSREIATYSGATDDETLEKCKNEIESIINELGLEKFDPIPLGNKAKLVQSLQKRLNYLKQLFS